MFPLNQDSMDAETITEIRAHYLKLIALNLLIAQARTEKMVAT